MQGYDSVLEYNNSVKLNVIINKPTSQKSEVVLLSSMNSFKWITSLKKRDANYSEKFRV